MIRLLAHRRRCAEAALALVAWIADFEFAPASTIGPPVEFGTISADDGLDEVSGIVDSRSLADVFWVHNDSGDAARFYAIDHDGDLLGAFTLAGAAAGDWEDVAIGPNPGGGNYLYLGDVGDNLTNRSSITVYRTTEPSSTASATIPVANYATARLRYPGGARNCESMFVDPATSDLYLITKSDTTTEIFRAPSSVFGGPITNLTPLGALGAPLLTASAADISPNGRHILVRNRTQGYLFERGAGQSVADALDGEGIPFTPGAEPQGEAICWAADGASFYTASETGGEASAPIYSYAYTPPQPGDFDVDGDVDVDDLDAWRTHFGAAADADADGDLDSDGDDLLIWQRNAVVPQTPAAAPVPEPAAIIAASVGALVLAAASRDRMRRH